MLVLCDKTQFDHSTLKMTPIHSQREERRLCKYAVRTSAMVYSQYNTVLFTVQKPRAAVKKAQTPPTPP